ncbi:MAG: energy transducer TonB [Chloroflexia bacterium]|nr:energy transducer TonB [Chloroflexia bacterium]
MAVCYFLFTCILISQNKRIGSYDEEVNDSVYLLIDKMPRFPGGETALKSFIANNLQYPVTQSDYAGKVYVRFIIDEHGKVIKPQVIRGVDPLLDKEALRVVKTIPDWVPGEINGKKVKVWYVVPVDFYLY